MSYQPLCPYCEQPAMLVTGERVYPKRPDLARTRYWLCGPCDAFVGCHRPGAWIWRDGVKVVSDGTLPLGRLSNASLRRMKHALHREFDPLWRDGHMERVQAYKWLARRMGMHANDCHIGYFDERQCEMALRHVRDRRDRDKKV